MELSGTDIAKFKMPSKTKNNDANERKYIGLRDTITLGTKTVIKILKYKANLDIIGS